MWGGRQDDLSGINSEKKETMTSAPMHMYHLPTGTWEMKPTNGNHPLGVWGYSSIAVGKNIYYFGGYGSGYHNSLHCFNAETFNWRELSPSSSNHGPMMKRYCGMVTVHFDGEDYLAIIGGIGSSTNTTPKQPDAQYNSGSCNEIHYYRISSGQYN